MQRLTMKLVEMRKPGGYTVCFVVLDIVLVYLYNICEQDLGLLFFGTASSKDYFSIEREMDQTQ